MTSFPHHHTARITLLVCWLIYQTLTSVWTGDSMNEQGQLKVNECLQVVGRDDVFAIGDCNDIEVSWESALMRNRNKQTSIIHATFWLITAASDRRFGISIIVGYLVGFVVGVDHLNTKNCLKQVQYFQQNLEVFTLLTCEVFNWIISMFFSPSFVFFCVSTYIISLNSVHC